MFVIPTANQLTESSISATVRHANACRPHMAGDRVFRRAMFPPACRLTQSGITISGFFIVTTGTCTYGQEGVSHSLENFLRASTVRKGKRLKMCMALHAKSKLRATERHLPYGITQCYLPPDTSLEYPTRLHHRLLVIVHFQTISQDIYSVYHFEHITTRHFMTV